MATVKPIDAYRNAGLDASIAGASPHHLILMLFQGARVALTHGRLAMSQGNVAARAHALSKVAAIIDDGLKASLDKTKGGPLAAQLDALYDYMVLTIARANVENSIAKLDEVDQLLAGLEESWRQIGAAPRARPAPAPEAAPVKRAALSYGKA
ncbi:MAG: flagellar export chaperone FliS [Burkholderiales bacterium]|nr:flagellar export chaperone FliS [Burkholderiales bacterium]